MKFEVKTEELKKVVSCASRATSSKAIQPILNNILIKKENGMLKLTTTNLEMGINTFIAGKIEGNNQGWILWVD